jgi:DNA-binding PadR family transcriptional regulator
VTAVFSHGRLRLYLFKLLAEGPKHGYELIRLLENRFLGLYAPSAGTIYPRLQRMEAEGLVVHTQAGGRKVYEITDAGRAELAARAGELADLEAEIHASVADLTTLATEIEQHVSGSVRDLKRELRDAAREIRSAGRQPWAGDRARWGAPPAPAPSAPPGPRSTGGPPPGAAPTTDDPSTGTTATNGASGTAGTAATNGPSGADGPTAAGRTAHGPVEDLEREIGRLAAEVRRMVRHGSAGDAQLRAAAAVVTSALTELRRLLRG